MNLEALNQPTQPKIEKFMRTSKKREPKVVEPEVEVESSLVMSDDDINDLISSAKKEIDGVFSATEDSELVQVNDWIKMPAPIQKVIGAEGIPCGLITMVIGKKDCGKTTFAVEALASAQRDGGIAILLDTENKFSLKRAAHMGLDVRKMIIIQATTIEEAFEKFQAMVNLIKNKVRCIDKKTGEVVSKDQYDDMTPANKKKFVLDPIYASKKVVCVWDSLGATPSEAEMDESVKDFSMTAAKVIKGHLRKTVRYIRDTKVAFVIINQVYTNMNKFGKQTTSYGGSGPEYHSAIILEFVKMGHVRPSGVKAGEGDFCGTKSQIECTKNHLAQPFKKVDVEIDFKGFVVGRSPEYAPEEILKELKEEENDDEPSAKELSRREKVKKVRASKK